MANSSGDLFEKQVNPKSKKNCSESSRIVTKGVTRDCDDFDLKVKRLPSPKIGSFIECPKNMMD